MLKVYLIFCYGYGACCNVNVVVAVVVAVAVVAERVVYGLWWHEIRAAMVRPRCHELLSLMDS